MKATLSGVVLLALSVTPITLFAAGDATAQSRLLVAEGLSTVSRLGHGSGAYYADKYPAVNSIEDKCRNKKPANNVQAKFIRVLGARLPVEDFKRMCRKEEDREKQLREIDKELLKIGIILGEVQPKTAPPFGDIPRYSNLVNGGTAIGFDVGATSVSVTRGSGTGLEPGVASFYVNDSWKLNDKWSFNIGVRYDDDDGVKHAPVQDLTPYVSLGAGLTALGQDNIQLNGFNQFLKTGTAEYVAIEIGVEKRLSKGYNLLGSFTFQRNNLDIESLGNNPPVVSSLPLGGNIQTWSFAPRIGLSHEIVRNGKTRLVPWAMLGAGVAVQDLSATNGGATVLSGSKTTVMVTFAGGIKFPVNDRVSVGVNGFINWFDGFNVTAGPGVNAAFASRTEVGGYISVDVKNPFRMGY